VYLIFGSYPIAQIKDATLATLHHRRSNTELAQALRESGGEDPDFRAAINENVVIILRKQAEAMEMRANVNNDRAARGLPPLPPSTLNSMSSTNAGAESSDLSAPTLNSAPTDQSNSLASSEATLETDAPVTAEANPDSSAAPIGLDNRTDGGGLFL
jgi:hypothetical protein